MKSQKQFILSVFIIMFLYAGTAFAQTCFDPNYGYYDCNQQYYYPDQGQAFVEGAFLGMVVGGFASQGFGGDGGHGHWGGHGGGGGGHHGGGGGGHHH